VAGPPSNLEKLRTRLRVAVGKPDRRDGWRWNRLAHPRTRSDFAIHRMRATVEGYVDRARWGEVERFCFFVGYGRSGSSLLGSLLNAHPDVVIAHELGVIPYVEHGFTRNQLYGTLLRRDRDFASLGRRWTGYEYAVPHQHQGDVRRLRVVGDKHGEITALQIDKRPHSLAKLRATVGVPIRALYVTRNPYDNIATFARRMRTSIDDATAKYADLCRCVDTVTSLLGPDELLHVDYDAFLGAPGPGLAALCRFLDVDAEPAYLDDCASVVWAKPSRTRHDVDWSDAQRRSVQAILDAHRALHHYTFDD
jgi:hypothetical protein